MPLFKSHTGINITTDKIQVVEIDYRDERFYLENVDEEYFSDFLDFSEKETKFNSILQRSFDELLLRHPLKSNLVSFSLPQSFFKIIDLSYDKSMIRADLFEHFKWEMGILYPQYQAEDFITQFIEVHESSLRKDENVIIIAAIKKALKMIHKFTVRNNLKLKFVDYSHVASNSLLRINSTIDKEDIVLSLYYTDKWLSVMLLYKNSPIFVECKQIDSVAEVIPTVSNIVDSLTKFDIDKSKINKFVVSGSNVSSSFIEKLNSNIFVTFEKVDPFKDLLVNDKVNFSQLFNEKANSFSAATGIALRLL